MTWSRRSILLSLASMGCFDPVADFFALVEQLHPVDPPMVWGRSVWGRAVWRIP